MAGRRRHRMTPKRRAALRKAQMASARKRRRFGGLRKFAKGAGAVGGAVGATFVAYHTQEYIARPDMFVRHTGAAGGATGRAVKRVVRKVASKGGVPTPKTTSHVKYQHHGYL
jgi:hypothetical protein